MQEDEGVWGRGKKNGSRIRSEYLFRWVGTQRHWPCVNVAAPLHAQQIQLLIRLRHFPNFYYKKSLKILDLTSQLNLNPIGTGSNDYVKRCKKRSGDSAKSCGGDTADVSGLIKFGSTGQRSTGVTMKMHVRKTFPGQLIRNGGNERGRTTNVDKIQTDNVLKFWNFGENEPKPPADASQ